MPASKLNDATLKNIKFCIEKGASPNIAAIASGVSRYTVNDWRTEGNKILKAHNHDLDAIEEWIENHEEMTKDDKRRSRMVVKYVLMVKKARVDCVMPVEFKAREMALDGSNPTHTLKWLSHQHPEVWDERQTLQVTGGTTHVIKQIVIHGNEEKLQLEKQNPVDVEFEEVDDVAETVS